MSENIGWVKLHRKLLENPLIKEPRLLQVLVYLLLKASHQETKIIWNEEELILKPGQVITGREKANKDLKLKSKMFDRKLKILENIGIVTRQVTNRFSIITIVNWEEYQSRQEEMTSKMTNRRPTDDHIQEGTKNEEEVKTFPVGKTKDTEVESDGLPKHKPKVDKKFLKKAHEDVLRIKKEIRDKQKSQAV